MSTLSECCKAMLEGKKIRLRETLDLEDEIIEYYAKIESTVYTMVDIYELDTNKQIMSIDFDFFNLFNDPDWGDIMED